MHLVIDSGKDMTAYFRDTSLQELADVDICLEDLANTSSLVQVKEYAMSLKQRLEESSKIDEAHIFLDFNDDDSTMPSKSRGASNIGANPTRAEDYSQLSL